MTATVTFPDVVALVIGHLTDAVDVPVRKRVPNPRPVSFVTVLRTGGPRRGWVVDDAQVTIDCWAGTDEDCADLTAEVRAAVNAMHGQVVDGTQIYRVIEVGGPADLPDPLSDTPRMRWTVTVQTRGSDSGS